MATGAGAGEVTGAAVGACFGQSSGVAMAAIMTAATGSNHRGERRFFCTTAGAGSDGTVFMRTGSGLYSSSSVIRTVATGVISGASACSKVTTGAGSGSGSLIITGSGSGTNDSRRQSSTSSRAFSLRLTKPQKQITGLPSTRKTKFSPGNWKALESRDPNSCCAVFGD